ncbi:MAG TPA: VWA domain-containing protein [Anaerolineae bacterium]|nr:VWA domain-containing protein [Anaerolineae bacterium]
MSRKRSDQRTVRVMLGLLVVGLFLVIAVCCVLYSVVDNLVDGEADVTPGQEPAPESALVVAYSPEKEILFRALVDQFNAQGLESTAGERMQIVAVERDPAVMVEEVLQGSASYHAIAPDSSVWLGQIDEEWRTREGDEAIAVGETVRFAVSPVVIAMWEDVAREMGWPDGDVSWQDLLNRATADPDFAWSHPSTGSASGLLATLAEFYAGAGKTRGLTIEDVQAQATLDYVAALENTVRYYGAGDEPAIIEQALREGRDFLDAFVVQEQMVVYFNTHRGDQPLLVAVYPVEGTLWEDHPLALLETGVLTPLQRQIFGQFRDFVLSAEAQALVLRHGYRPANLLTALDSADSPLNAENGVNAAEPKTTLQIPNPAVISVVRDVWWYTKRHTNVYLVVDTSGSMRGDKMAQAQAALDVFIEQIEGDLERVGLIQFSTGVEMLAYLDELGNNRAALEQEINSLYAEGDTALLDGVYEAYARLQNLGDSERINAIVVMTDGQENNSNISLRSLVRKLEEQAAVPVVVFCIAYGDDADITTLRSIAEPTGGQVFEGDLDTIRDLYKIISTYF